ncbi:hypothetical protein OPIT5_21665 [Opitutaceae bacterium TAV5]|nr:hypothetical protein OPIT5_21665 [Opitutaceae bacterium TAV5]
MNDNPYPPPSGAPKPSWHIGALRLASVVILVAGIAGTLACIIRLLAPEHRDDIATAGYALAIAFGSWVWFVMLRAIAHVIERLDR